MVADGLLHLWNSQHLGAIFVNSQDLGINNQRALEEAMHLFFSLLCAVLLFLMTQQKVLLLRDNAKKAGR